MVVHEKKTEPEDRFFIDMNILIYSVQIVLPFSGSSGETGIDMGRPFLLAYRRNDNPTPSFKDFILTR